jgi:outer membrane lipoprotein-sorting protein
MNLAIMTAISTICVEAATFGTPAAVAQQAVTEEVVAATLEKQTEAPNKTPAEDLTAPATEEISDAPIQNTNDNIILDEEQFSGPLAFEGESDDAVVARLVEYIEALDTLQGDLTQIAPSGTVSEGRFYLRRPGLLRFEYDPPTPLLIVANSGMVYVRDDALETTDSYPVGRTPLKFLLRRNIDLEKADVVAIDRGVDTVAVTLASKEEETEGEISIIVSAPEMALKRWVVRDLQNGITIVNLDNVIEGQRLANRLFRAPEAGGEFLKN